MNAEAIDPATAKAPKAAWAILAAMGFGALIAQMFSTVIGPALPVMQTDLDLSYSTNLWISTSYSLAFGAALVAGGRLGDLIGEVRIIVIGFLIFAAGLLMSAIATGGAMMISGRTIQGIGIGLSAPATLSIVVNVFPIARRGLAVGTWGLAHGIGLFAGPIMAGYLLTYLNWRWMFWIALPLTGLVILVVIAATRGYTSRLASGSYDVIGLILGAGSITAITYGLQSAGEGWLEPTTLGSLAVGAIAMVAFLVVEMRVEYPLVDLSLFKRRLFSGAFFAESAVGFVYIPMLTFVGSLYIIGVLGFSPLDAGWIIAITTVTCMVLEAPAGWVVDRIGSGIPIVVALLMISGSLFWMGTFDAHTTLAMLVGPLALMGAGVGVALPSCNTAGMSAVSKSQAGMGSGLMQMTFNIPAALGVALVTSIVGTMTASRIAAAMSGTAYDSQASAYAAAVHAGNESGAAEILKSLPVDIATQLQSASLDAQASTIATGMVALAFVALAGAVMAAIVIGRRRGEVIVEAEIEEMAA